MATSSSRFPKAGSLRFIGLSSGNGGTNPSEIRFALRLQGGNAEVRESGAYRAETRFAASDTLRIAYVGGTVQYSKNGNVFYTSGTGPVYPAIVDTTLFDDNATVWNVMIAQVPVRRFGGSDSRFVGFVRSVEFVGFGCTADLRPGRVNWTSDSNVAINGNSLIKTGGCSGCPDAGAVSAQQISSGDGYVEFSGEGSGLRFIGLSSGNNGTDASEIRFALRLQGGTAEVRESGGYRSEIGFSSGDTLRVAIVGGNVEYSKNGSVFYTSSAQRVVSDARRHVALRQQREDLERRYFGSEVARSAFAKLRRSAPWRRRSARLHTGRETTRGPGSPGILSQVTRCRRATIRANPTIVAQPSRHIV